MFAIYDEDGCLAAIVASIYQVSEIIKTMKMGSGYIYFENIEDIPATYDYKKHKERNTFLVKTDRG